MVKYPSGPPDGTSPTHKANGRAFFMVHRTVANCHLRSANCVLYIALRNILQITILEFFRAGLQDMGHNAPL